MQPKKSPKADLEGRRSLYFLIGLSLSIILAITVLQYQQRIYPPNIPEQEKKEYADEDVIITLRDKPEKAEKKEVKPKEKTKLNLKDFTEPDPEGPDEKPEELPSGKIDESKLANIGHEDQDTIETIPAFIVERLAVPMECAALIDRSQQKDCLNNWIHRYILEHTNYPSRARELRLQGKVYVTFVISETGEVESAMVEREGYRELDGEALRVIESLPQFRPASQRDQKVKMRMTVPVNFKID